MEEEKKFEFDPPDASKVSELVNLLDLKLPGGLNPTGLLLDASANRERRLNAISWKDGRPGVKITEKITPDGADLPDFVDTVVFLVGQKRGPKKEYEVEMIRWRSEKGAEDDSAMMPQNVNSTEINFDDLLEQAKGKLDFKTNLSGKAVALLRQGLRKMMAITGDFILPEPYDA